MSREWNNNGFFMTAELAKKSPIYQELLEAVREKERSYLEVLAQLTPTQRQAVEGYLAACEAMDYEFAHLAYEAGRNFPKQS